MKLLLDTHAFLWFVLNDSRLSKPAAELIAESENELLLSPASYWELAIKISIGKYTLPEPFAVFMNDQIVENDLAFLPIAIEHANVVATLPFHHRDPFDRLLIAQAMVEDIGIASTAKAFDDYAIRRHW